VHLLQYDAALLSAHIENTTALVKHIASVDVEMKKPKREVLTATAVRDDRASNGWQYCRYRIDALRSEMKSLQSAIDHLAEQIERNCDCLSMGGDVPDSSLMVGDMYDDDDIALAKNELEGYTT